MHGCAVPLRKLIDPLYRTACQQSDAQPFDIIVLALFACARERERKKTNKYLLYNEKIKIDIIMWKSFG